MKRYLASSVFLASLLSMPLSNAQESKFSGNYLSANAHNATETIYATPHPYGSNLGIYGYGLFNSSPNDSALNNQSAAIRFMPNANYELKTVGLWLMNNSDTDQGTVYISLHENDTALYTEGMPGNLIAQWTIEEIKAKGWLPRFENTHVPENITLEKDKYYWIVAESPERFHNNPVWNFSHDEEAFITLKEGEQWLPGEMSAPLAIDIKGIPLNEDE